MIHAEVDTREVEKQLRQIAKQVPYATSVALNRVANTAQQEMRREVQRKFTLRREQFILNTIKIAREDRARKDKLDVTIRVDPQRDILAKFEAGGTKTPRDGGHIAIPTTAVRRNKSDVIQRSQRPRALLDSKSAAKGKVRKTKSAIVRLTGRAAARVTNVLYVLKASVRIPPRLGFVKTVSAVAQREMPKEMEKALQDAISTAK